MHAKLALPVQTLTRLRCLVTAVVRVHAQQFDLLSLRTFRRDALLHRGRFTLSPATPGWTGPRGWLL